MGIVVVFGMMLFGLVAAGTWATRAWRTGSRARRMTGLAGAALFALGWASWCVIPLAAAGGLNWVPASFEWPVGWSDGAVRLSDGRWAVPHEAAGRVQIYDERMRFVRGWEIDASGGAFRLVPLEGGGVAVLTARGARRYTFDRDGTRMGSGMRFRGEFEAAKVHETSVRVPTPVWGWTLVSPAFAWLAVVVGALTAWAASRSGEQGSKPRADAGEPAEDEPPVRRTDLSDSMIHPGVIRVGDAGR
jgi:hypothetical protein